MSSSYTVSDVFTFTLTNAKHMAAKVATDLKRMQRFYGFPSDSKIAEFEDELIALVKAGYLGTVAYGFKRDGLWIEPTLKYEAQDLFGSSGTDDDPGKVRPGLDISGASFYSYLTYSYTWDQLTSEEQSEFKRTLPLNRGGANEPGINGFLAKDLTYSSGGRALNRSCVRSY
jgi:hypothetical protein